MPSPVLLIVNPVSGQRDFDEALSQVTGYLEERAIEYEIRQTEGEGDALDWARNAAGYGMVIVGGGDGTVMEAMSGMIENTAPIPLAQLPLGTANLLARALAIPSDLKEALDLAFRDGVVASLDVGYLPEHNRYFAIVAGSGWDAEMISDADRDMKDKLGFFAYIVSGIKHLFGLKQSRVRITIDGKRRRFRAHTVMVINIGEIYGAKFSLGKAVSPHDGKLDLAIASSRSVFGFIVVLFQILLRRFEDSESLRYFSASNVKIEASPPLKLEIDGEAIGETPFEVRVVPSGARLVVPREYVESKKVEFQELPSRLGKEETV